MKNAKTKIIMTSTISIIIAIALVPMLTSDAFAKHSNDSNGVLDKRYELHIWSRTASDGHRGYLNCDATNTDDCNLKIKIHNSIQSITKAQVQTEVDTIEGIFDGLNKKMSIDRVTSGTDNIVQRYGLDAHV